MSAKNKEKEEENKPGMVRINPSKEEQPSEASEESEKHTESNAEDEKSDEEKSEASENNDSDEKESEAEENEKTNANTTLNNTEYDAPGKLHHSESALHPLSIVNSPNQIRESDGRPHH